MKKTLPIFLFLVLFSINSNASNEPFGSAQGEPLTIEESINVALKNNLTIVAAQKKVKAYEGRVGQAFSGFLPSLILQGEYGNVYQSPISTTVVMGGIPQTVSMGIDETSVTQDYMLSLKQPLYAGGSIVNSYNIALKELEIAKEDLRNAELDLIYNVYSAYFGVILAKKSYSLALESLNMAKAHLERVNAMYSVGTAIKADVIRTEIQVANAEERLKETEKKLELAKNSFNNTLGRDLGEEVALSEEEFNLDEMYAVKYEEFLDEAYKNRPDLISLKKNREIAESGLSLAYSGFYPKFFVVGNYGSKSIDYPQSKIKFDVNSWNALLTGSWNIFDGLNTPNKISEATNNLEMVKSNEENLKKGVAVEIKDATMSLNDALARVKSTNKTVDLATENLKISELRYKEGVGTNIDVIDAQVTLYDAKVNNLKAKHDYELAKAKINKAVGREVFKLRKKASYTETFITLEGTVKYVDLEGGFIGFIDKEGKHYDLVGKKVSEIKKIIGKSEAGKRVKISGKLRSDILTIHMWGTPLEVINYEWK